MARKTKNKQTKVTQSNYQISSVEYENTKWEIDMTVSGMIFKLPITEHDVYLTIRSFGKGWIWDVKDFDDTTLETSLMPRYAVGPRNSRLPRVVPGVVFTTPADAAADVCLNPLPEPFNERAPKGQGWTLYRS